jgi:hypothetical protein
MRKIKVIKFLDMFLNSKKNYVLCLYVFLLKKYFFFEMVGVICFFCNNNC